MQISNLELVHSLKRVYQPNLELELELFIIQHCMGFQLVYVEVYGQFANPFFPII